MPGTNQRDPMFEFRCHVGAVCAFIIVMVMIDGGKPNDPTPLALLPTAAMMRWIESLDNGKWAVSTIILDLAIGLMAADIIATWTRTA